MVAATIVVAAVVVVSAAIAVASFHLRCCWHFPPVFVVTAAVIVTTAVPVYTAVRNAMIVVVAEVIIQPRATGPGENHSGGGTLQRGWRKMNGYVMQKGEILNYRKLH